MQSLLNLPTEKLLEKFGSGGHVPGSGSAAALLGLLSANLIKTVCQLTVGKIEYKKHHALMRSISDRIERKLIPQLNQLFQQDADVFDKVITVRKVRDKSSDAAQVRASSDEALAYLRHATAVVFQIAEICSELIDQSEQVFDNGFRAAKGDSGVALTSAISGLSSAIFVINVNLKLFQGTYWARQQRKDCDEFQRIATEKQKLATAYLARLREEDIKDIAPLDEREPTLRRMWAGVNRRSSTPRVKAYTRADIEKLSSDLRRLVWNRKAEIWPDGSVPHDPVEILDPQIAIKLLGYGYTEENSLGTLKNQGRNFEAAGLLDGRKGHVRISTGIRSDVRLFTAAHELGHIILHPHMREAHRDIPLDGSGQYLRSREEREADQFASSYLLPPKLMRMRFHETFGIKAFTLNEETSFALFGLDFGAARKRVSSLRSLSRILAQTNSFNGNQIIPLSSQFGVSVEAMAIRLEELELVVWT